MYKRPILKTISKRLKEPRRFIQVLSGPRQTGKTTLARQAMEEFKGICRYASADEPALKGGAWLEQQWDITRAQMKGKPGGVSGLLILDEVQKIPGWPEAVKRLWDEDTASRLPLKVMLLGSSPPLMSQGPTESLAGRFEIIPVTHWPLAEMSDAFGWSLDQYVYFGGYPGAAELIGDGLRWSRYILDSLVETTISRDVLLMKRVDKPALLRRMFELGCAYSGQVLSYQKMLGQLHDAGNTTTLAHYLNLLQSAGLLAGIQKYAGQRARQRASSPKLIAMNSALMTSQSHLSFKEASGDRQFWGRLTESAVGAYLANSVIGSDLELFYWSSGHQEVDFVLARGEKLAAIEVKSGRAPSSLPGVAAFVKEFPVRQKLLVGADGIPIDEFLRTDVGDWL